MVPISGVIFLHKLAFLVSTAHLVGLVWRVQLIKNINTKLRDTFHS